MAGIILNILNNSINIFMDIFQINLVQDYKLNSFSFFSTTFLTLESRLLSNAVVLFYIL